MNLREKLLYCNDDEFFLLLDAILNVHTQFIVFDEVFMYFSDKVESTGWRN